MLNKLKTSCFNFFKKQISHKKILVLFILVLSFNLTYAQKALKIVKDDGSITYINAGAVNTITFVSPLAIGDSYQGGIIFYLDANGEHGLIAATSDQSTGIQWGSSSTTGATGDNIEVGEENTSKIVGKQGSGSYAPKLCSDLNLGGYSDWYLPSKYELNLVYEQKALIDGFTTNGYYWTSTEYSSGDAWEQYFFDGGTGHYGKTNTDDRVRAIRSF